MFSHTHLARTAALIVITLALSMPTSARGEAPSTGVIKGSRPTLYYSARDGKRYVFPNVGTYRSWYTNFRNVQRVTDDILGTIPIGGNVTYRPGARLVKVTTDPKVYAVDRGGTLRWVASESVARALYGDLWNRHIDDIPDAFFVNYRVGAPIQSTSDFSPSAVVAGAPDIDAVIATTMSALAGPATNDAPSTGGAGASTAPAAGPASSPPAAGAGSGSTSGTSGTSGTTGGAAASPATTSPAAAPTTPAPPPPAAPVGTTATAGITSASRVIAATTLASPAVGSRVTDPTYGTTIRRMTNRVASGGFGTHVYSQLQAFSSDNQYILLNEDGDYVVRRVDTLVQTPANLTNTNAPRWQPAQPGTVVAFDTNEDTTLRAQYHNVATGTITTVYTFPTSYQRITSNRSFDELSHNGRWMGGMASTANDDQMFFALDLTNRTLGAQISLNSLYRGVCRPDPQYGNVWPDWVGVSPLGRYLVVQWTRDGDERCSGLETYDIRTGAFVGHVYDGHQHGDLGVDRDGTTEFFMTFEMTHPTDGGRPGQGIRVLPGPATGVATPRYLQLMDWGNQSHISCQGPNGVCLVTSGADTSLGGWTAFEGELWLQYTDGRVLRLTQHRSTECGYWVQPRASVSRDGRYVVFASDWGTARCAASNDNLGRGEAYLIELPVGLAAAGPSAAANATTQTPAATTAQPTPPAAAAPPPADTTTAAPAATSATVGPLPSSTYTLRGDEAVTFDPAESPWTIVFNHTIGEGTCFGTDWIQYDLYVRAAGATDYTRVGSHRGPDATTLTGGHAMETQGCAKGAFLYTLTRGTYDAAMCITNTRNTGQRYCTAPLRITAR